MGGGAWLALRVGGFCRRSDRTGHGPAQVQRGGAVSLAADIYNLSNRISNNQIRKAQIQLHWRCFNEWPFGHCVIGQGLCLTIDFKLDLNLFFLLLFFMRFCGPIYVTCPLSTELNLSSSFSELSFLPLPLALFVSK